MQKEDKNNTHIYIVCIYIDFAAKSGNYFFRSRSNSHIICFDDTWVLVHAPVHLLFDTLN